jgi:hypothetical protein
MQLIVNNCLYLNLQSFVGMITFIKNLYIHLGVGADTLKLNGFFI